MKQTLLESTGASGGSFKSYATGFILSIVLTTLAFWLVMQGEAMPRGIMFVGIFVAGTLQILVHLHYFLHLNTSSAACWNVLVLLFTLLIMTIFIGGSLWIMFNLNYRMM